MPKLKISDMSKIDNFKELLEDCINRMCETDDKNGLEEQYDYAIKYIRAIRSINHDRLYGENNNEMS